MTEGKTTTLRNKLRINHEGPISILKSLKNNGGKMKRADLLEDAKTNTTLTSEELELDFTNKKTGIKEFTVDRFLGLSITELKKLDLIDNPVRGVWELTSKGQNIPTDDNVQYSNLLKELNPWEKTKEPTIEDSNGENDSNQDDSYLLNWKTDYLAKIMDETDGATWFEQLSRRLMSEMGIDVDSKKGVSPTHDGGIDGFGVIRTDDFRTQRVVVQSKRHKDNISSPDIDKFVGAISKNNAEYGIFITTSDFTESAKEAAKQGGHIVTLINGDELLELILKYEIGGKRKNIEVLDINEGFFKEQP